MNKPKASLYLMGGLGNNLSQLFFAYKLQLLGYEIEVNNFLCTKNFITKILKWSIHDQTVQEIYSSKFVIKKINIIKVIADLILLNFSRVFNGWFLKWYFDANCIGSLNELLKQKTRKHIVLAGYWQQLNIYSEHELNEFRDYLFENINKSSLNNLGIHIRGGDFIKWNKNLNISFYNNALDQVKRIDSATIFTNDKNFSREFLPNSISYQFSLNGNSKNDFMEMLSFERLICSNSTFSIWAGLLSFAERIIIPQPDGESLKMNINVESFKTKKIVILKM